MKKTNLSTGEMMESLQQELENSTLKNRYMIFGRNTITVSYKNQNYKIIYKDNTFVVELDGNEITSDDDAENIIAFILA